ncbi:O-antigen ligase family protein [Microbacterium sp. ASV49]|uniref:O-antigen ligase family protein n=1 Tax=Microbacterium candidum TaxID=3041922 RepID=A0ABT7N0Z9_9MICO|nr:O-antigen ligase family protein [Microbacterium sp. ASV49]MDL9980336.1 O-antigen ligase family protein [Microbacterium sp. ASV49]
MSTPAHGHRPVHYLAEVLRSANFARAYTLASLAAVFGGYAIEHMSSTVTYVTIILGLVLIGGGMLVARRDELSLFRIAPLSVIAFLVWALASAFWSSDAEATVVRWFSLAGLAVIAIVIAQVRDTLQTARALGDVMRVLLSISLALEILSGILLDIPITFLGIQGNIAAFGPVQGIFGTRNLLGFYAVIALITFLIEWRTNSVRPGVSAFSVILGGVLAVLSDSPTVVVLGVSVAAVTGVLVLVRHTHPASRAPLQWGIGAVVAIGLIAAYFLRRPIVQIMGAGTDFSTRVDLWRTIATYTGPNFYPVQGWGWFGPWDPEQFPFNVINLLMNDHHTSALNAYVDVLLQLGWVGLVLFVALAGIALVRSWLVASERRSVVYAWTPLILVTLLIDSVFESFTLFSAGWLLLVLCAARAGQSRSWRDRIEAAEPRADLPAA